MRKDNDFADVTLACEDGQQVEAHKVILAGQVLIYKLPHSHHHINITNIKTTNINDIGINEHKSFTSGGSEGPKQLDHFKSKLDVVMGPMTK